MAPPTFYLAIGRDPRRRDLQICLAAGQQHFLVPAGTRGAKLLQALPDVHIIIDSGAWPPSNPERLTLEHYARLLLEQDRRIKKPSTGPARATIDWFAPYDHMFRPQRTALDEKRLRAMLPGEVYDDWIVRLVQFPSGSASEMLAELQYDMTILDEDERASLEGAQRHGAVDGPVARPACALGGLVPARYSKESQDWYHALLIDLEAAIDLAVANRTLHLFGISRPSYVLHPLVASFDSSTPFRMAQFGYAQIERNFNPALGYTEAKLRVSREARLAYWLTAIRARTGLAWSRIDEATLLDDSSASLKRQERQRQPVWTQVMIDTDWLVADQIKHQGRAAAAGE